jgi:micrococcal nuclease
MDKKGLIIILGILVIIDVLFLIFYIGDVFGQPFKHVEKGFVSKVIDGDTVIINGESVRLLGIDSDEKGYPCYNSAKKKIEELVLNKEVILEKGNEDKDRYERLLRYLIIENEYERINVNLQMVEDGFAVARFHGESEYKSEIVNAEKNARNNKVGCKWIKVD